jgi:hypothetical protein
MDYSENIRLAIGALFEHKMRSFLTMLGIIFGVACVIAILWIGGGADSKNEFLCIKQIILF